MSDKLFGILNFNPGINISIIIQDLPSAIASGQTTAEISTADNQVSA